MSSRLSAGGIIRMFYVEQLPAEIDEEDGNVSGGDAGDAGGLGNRGRPIAHQFLTTFDREGLYLVEVEVGGNLDVLKSIVLLGLLTLALDIARILDPNLDGFDDIGGECSMWNNLKKVRQGEFRASDEFVQTPGIR